MERSMLDIAYDLISESKKGIKFAELFEKVAAEKGITNAAQTTILGRFYSDLSLDGRFVVLDDNTWDLRERYTYDNVHVEIGEAYQDVEQTDEDEEEKVENKEYDASMHGLTAEETVEPVADDSGDSDSSNPQA